MDLHSRGFSSLRVCLLLLVTVLAVLAQVRGAQKFSIRFFLCVSAERCGVGVLLCRLSQH